MDYQEMLRDEMLKLAMLAGAFAIRNNKKYNTGFFTSGGKSMSWSEAEKWLECTARGLDPLECEIVKEKQESNKTPCWDTYFDSRTGIIYEEFNFK